MFHYNRSASTLITLFGAITNSVLTIQVLAAWRSIKWEPESEWESSEQKWQLTGVKIIWGLLSIYFASAASVCAIGFHGVVKVRHYHSSSKINKPTKPQHKPSHVRFYRDYSIADFSFCAFLTALVTYGAFLSPARAGVCEEFSHHPELMRDMLEIGLSVENCELWLERAVFAGLAITFVIMVIRVSFLTSSFLFVPLLTPPFQLHFLLAVSNYYSHLARHHHQHQRSPSCSSASPSCSTSSHSLAASTSHSMQRIFVLPSKNNHNNLDLENGVELIYAPVPRHTLSKDLQEQATEAWISTPSPSSSSSSPSSGSRADGVDHRHHHHRQHHHHRHSSSRRHRSSSRETTGLIRLDIAPDEGLLPQYKDVLGDTKA